MRFIKKRKNNCLKTFITKWFRGYVVLSLKATGIHRFRPSAVHSRTLWTVQSIIAAQSTQLSAPATHVTTTTDSRGSLASIRMVSWFMF